MKYDGEVECVVIGAGPAGLGVAACLRQIGVPFELLERNQDVGSSWRNHYLRLHLHTPREYSGLPLTPVPDHFERYPARLEFVAYLDGYADEHDISPRFGVEVQRVAPDGDHWMVEADGATWRCRHVVFCTGYNRVPREPAWPGREQFTGSVIHSSEYRTGSDYKGKRMLVVGCGNSGAEIALDLCEQGAASVALCVRGPINVIPRDILGVPAQRIGILTENHPPKVVDATMRAISRVMFGDLRRWGIERKKHGPLQQILQEKTIPLIDVGTVARIKSGEIKVVPGIERYTAGGLRFVDGSALDVDAVVLATGYTTGLEAMLDVEGVLDDRGYPTALPPETTVPGLHFVGFSNVPTGLIRHIAFDAESAAAQVADAVVS